MNKFLVRLKEAGLINDAGQIVLSVTSNGLVQAVDIEDFELMFGDALSSEDKHAALILADTNADGSVKGYAGVFNVWREMGLFL